MAIITSSIEKSIKIPDDSVFKISNNGFIGSPYIEIQLGNSEEFLKIMITQLIILMQSLWKKLLIILFLNNIFLSIVSL